jgi:hypothetical protein
MGEVIYAMRFSGPAEPVGEVGNVLKAATSAPSSTLSSTVGADGLTGTLAPASGDAATFASEVTFTGETSFLETARLASESATNCASPPSAVATWPRVRTPRASRAP